MLDSAQQGKLVTLALIAYDEHMLDKPATTANRYFAMNAAIASALAAQAEPVNINGVGHGAG